MGTCRDIFPGGSIPWSSVRELHRTGHVFPCAASQHGFRMCLHPRSSLLLPQGARGHARSTMVDDIGRGSWVHKGEQLFLWDPTSPADRDSRRGPRMNETNMNER